MTIIVIDPQQAKIISEAEDQVEIRDADGQHVGYVARGFTPNEVAEARRRLDSEGPWYTTQQVVEHIRSLAAE